MSKQIRETLYQFFGAGTPPASGSPDSGPFVSATVETGGSPSVTPNLGNMDLALDSTSEVQRATLFQNDELPFDIDELVRVEFLAKHNATPSSNVTVAFGVCSAFNATLDSIAQQAMFKMEGDGNILLETDDGTNDNDDIDSGIDVLTDYQRFVIDFARGVQTKSPPNASVGGKADVHFYVGNAQGHLRRVGKNTGFDMSNYSGGLQLFASIAKTSSADTGTLSIREICVTHKLNT